MSNIDSKIFKNAGFTFEEIESLQIAEKEIGDGKTITQDEMNLFIKNELFSKYTKENA